MDNPPQATTLLERSFVLKREHRGKRYHKNKGNQNSNSYRCSTAFSTETPENRPSFSYAVGILHVLNHDSLSHPALATNTMASGVVALKGRRMIVLQMLFEKLVSLEPIHHHSVARGILANIRG
jgi:hypothetical protein